MKWSKRKYLLLITGILLLSVLGYFAYILFVQEQYVATTLDAGANREIRIWSDTYFENCQRFYCIATHSTGARIGLHSCARLESICHSPRPVNSTVMPLAF